MFKRMLLIVMLALGSSSTIDAQPPATPFAKSIVRIDAGTVLNAPNPTRWNRVILLAKPRIASGDIGQLSESIRQAASMFVLSIAATVDQDPLVQESKYRLAEVGMGYSLTINNQQTVVHSDNYQAYGAQLSFFQRQMLAENERQLGTIKAIARGNSLLMFDVPALMLVKDKHVDFTIRHLIWIDTKTGKLATMVWLLQADRAKQLSVVSTEAIRWMESSTVEDRAIHVDGAEFTLGIPSKRAFALEQMPPGRPIAWVPGASSLAAQEAYTLESIQALLRALNEANRASQANNP